MSAIPPRIRLLVPVLGSPVDGEALGACRAIGRTLEGAGLDFHALAASIPTAGAQPAHRDFRAATKTDPYRHEARNPNPKPHVRPARDPWQQMRDEWVRQHRPRTYTPQQEATHRAQARFCRNEDRGRLNPRERRFVHDIANLHGALSVAQGDWLAAITDRLEQEDRCAWQ